MGFFDRTIETLGLQASFAAPPMMTGHGGGHDISLSTLAHLGVSVLGRCLSAAGKQVSFADDVESNLRNSDEDALRFCRQVDDYIRERGIDSPVESPLDMTLPPLDRRTTVDLGAEGITTVICATGFAHDFNWVTPAIGGERGYPVQRRGVTEYPGLYVLGLHVMWKQSSGLINGVGEDAAYLADRIAEIRDP